MGTTDDAEVTLVLASYNHSRYVREALTCVAAQDHDGLRLIVTDDASTDDSVSVIKRALSDLDLDATTQFHARNRGICATFNFALAAVETPYVAFLAADDLMDPSRITHQLRALKDEPAAALVYGDMWISRPTPGPQPERYSSWWEGAWPGGDHARLFHDLVMGNWIPAPAVLSRTAALRTVGGYDESLPYEDHDMWLRLARKFPFAYLEDPLVTYRQLPSSMSSQLKNGDERERRFTEVCMLSKHLGDEDEIDEWLAPRVMHLAVESYKSGNRSPEIARALRRCLIANPSLSALRYAVSATARVTRGN